VRTQLVTYGEVRLGRKLEKKVRVIAQAKDPKEKKETSQKKRVMMWLRPLGIRKRTTPPKRNEAVHQLHKNGRPSGKKKIMPSLQVQVALQIVEESAEKKKSSQRGVLGEKRSTTNKKKAEQSSTG